MLLGNLSPMQVAILKKAIEINPKATAFFEQLNRGDAKIYFSVNENDLSIRYEASSEDTFTGIVVTITREIYDEFKNFLRLSTKTLPPLSCALALYIHETEHQADEEALKQRYGHFYPLFAKFSDLSPSDIGVYLEQKQELEQLISELDSTYESQIIHQENDLNAAIELSIASTGRYNSFEISFSVAVGSRHKGLKLSELEELVTGKSSITIPGGIKASPIVISLSNFKDEDKQILTYLPVFVNANSFYYSKTAKSVNVDSDFAPLITLLQYYSGRDILFNNTAYHVDEGQSLIKMFLDENGAISPSFDADPNCTFLIADQMCAYFDKAEYRVKLMKFTSKKSRILYEFYQKHPDFRYGLFKEEIGGSVLPRLSVDTIIDKGFEESTKSYRSSIKYYVSYNDDLTLTMSTVFNLRGSDVDKETYISNDKSNRYDAFVRELDRLHLQEEGIYHTEDDIAPVLETDFSTLSRLCSLYLSDNLTNKKIKKTMPIRVNAESGIDWFELSFESDTLSEKEINAVLNAYRKKKKYIRIGDDFYSLDNEELSALAKRFTGDDENLTTQKLPLYQALHINHDGKSMVNLSKQLIELFHELSDYSNLDLPLKQHLKDVLRGYQMDGVRWLYSLSTHNLAGILADDMGLGKSLELISFLSLIQDPHPVLIVSPKSLLFNWEAEFHKWDPERTVIVLSSSRAERLKALSNIGSIDRPVLVVSYDTLRNDKEEFENIEYAAVILDEGQYIANAFAQKSKAVKILKAKHRFVLTGTPIQNSFMDLWSIFDFLMPGYLDDYKEFQNIYRGYESVHSEEGKRLEKMVAPFLLRRKKVDVLNDLPPKTEEVIRIQFEQEEKRLYTGYLANVKKELGKEENSSNKIAILAMLTRLRQLCVDPSSFLEYSEISTKLNYVLTMTKEAVSGGHKILIFSTFAEILLHLQRLFDENKVANHLIYGQTSAAKRLSYAEDFNNNPNVSVMLVSLKAGGTGLNLIGADIVVHLDPWWNIAAEEQATDRAHRIGQTRAVSVYKLIMVGSVEEKVIELQQKKKELTTILHSEGEVGASLTPEDIYFLLS